MSTCLHVLHTGVLIVLNVFYQCIMILAVYSVNCTRYGFSCVDAASGHVFCFKGVQGNWIAFLITQKEEGDF